jgi:hypothetical protein
MADVGDYPNDLEQGEEIRIDREPLSGVTYEVMDTTTEDLGLTEVVAVTLLAGCERYAIKWAMHSETASFVHLDGDDEWEINVTDIVLANEEHD